MKSASMLQLILSIFFLISSIVEIRGLVFPTSSHFIRRNLYRKIFMGGGFGSVNGGAEKKKKGKKVIDDIDAFNVAKKKSKKDSNDKSLEDVVALYCLKVLI